MKKRIISWLLSVAIIVGLIPATAVTVLASEPEAETVSDAYISVSVSRRNGGFTVQTVEGDRLKKSDNNKKLLYHDGQYDTSFLSFRVGEGENVKGICESGGPVPGRAIHFRGGEDVSGGHNRARSSQGKAIGDIRRGAL